MYMHNSVLPVIIFIAGVYTIEDCMTRTGRVAYLQTTPRRQSVASKDGLTSGFSTVRIFFRHLSADIARKVWYNDRRRART